jgi:hypothetical protein
MFRGREFFVPGNKTKLPIIIHFPLLFFLFLFYIFKLNKLLKEVPRNIKNLPNTFVGIIFLGRKANPGNEF